MSVARGDQHLKVGSGAGTTVHAAGEHIGHRIQCRGDGAGKPPIIGAHLRTGRHRSRKTPDLAKIIDQAQQRPLVAGRTDRTEPQRTVRRDRAVDRRFGIVDAASGPIARSGGPRDRGQRADCLDQSQVEIASLVPRPEQCCRDRRTRACQDPSAQPVRNGIIAGRDHDAQHEYQDRRVVAKRELAA